MIHKVPGRRGGAATATATAAGTVRLTVTGPEIAAVKQELAGLLKELGIGRATGTGDAEVTLEIDPRALPLCPIYVRALKQSKRVAREAEVSADQLAAVQARARALVVLLKALESLRMHLVGSRLIVAAAQGRLWDETLSALQRDLSGEALRADPRTRLKAAAGEVLAQVEAEQAQQKKRLEELKGARDDTASKIAEATARRRRLLALLNLQDDQEIDPEMIDELQRIYEQQVRVPGEEQRAARR